MGQKETFSLLYELGGFATAQEISEFASLYYNDEQLARGVGSDLHRLKKWESVDYDFKTKIWSIQN